jgi:hypothetical protein
MAPGPAEDTRADRDDYIVLDAENRIVRVGPALHAAMSPFLGHVLWERLPGAEPLYSPHFDEARRTGAPVEFTVFYAAELKTIRATPVGEDLAVHVTRIRQLEVTTLGTLAASLRAMSSELAAPASEPPDRPAAASLRALP